MLKSMKGLYKFHFDCGRMGELVGLFTQEVSEMDKLVNSKQEVYFGEVLGKHSEVYGEIGEDDYTLVTTDENVIKVVEDYGLENGYNPFDFIDE